MSSAVDNIGGQPVHSHHAALEQVLNAPLGKVVEAIDGKIYETDWPTPLHGRALLGLHEKVGMPYQNDDDKGGWKFLPRPTLQFSENLFIPNIAGWRKPQGLIGLNIYIVSDVPDWVCEILSPSTRPLVLGPKRDIYAKHGVEHLWLVDPYSQIVEAFEHRDGEFVSTGSVSDQGMVSLPPFDAVSFPLKHLWE